MPEEVTTDDTFLSKTQWENDFDLLQDLDETTSIGYFPKIAPRILLDDTSIDPSPINSRVNSQDIEMTSKSNFSEKNPAPTVVVLTPRKKRKMANVTNHQQEDMSLEVKDVKNSLFRKSVAGKENQGFDVAYAESEASNLTAATVDSPGKHFEMTDDSLDLTLTEAIVNVKKSIFMKKKSSVNLQASFTGKNDTADNSNVEKSANCKTISMSTTEAALKYPEDAVSTFTPEDVLEYPEDDVSMSTPEDDTANKTNLEPEINHVTEKNVPQELQTSFSSTSVVSSQEDSTTFSKPVLPFSRPSRQKKKNNFNVQCDETSTSSSESNKRDVRLPQDDDSFISTQSSQEEVLSQANEKRRTLFNKRNTKETDFEVNFETTGSGNNASSMDNSAKGNDLTKPPGNDKGTKVSGNEESPFSVACSQEETLSQLNNKRRKNTLFNKRSSKEASFKVNFETTESGNNDTNTDIFGKGNDSIKTPGNLNGGASKDEESPLSVPSSQEDSLPRRNVKRSTLFNKRKTKNADFKVDFEETGLESNNVSSVENSMLENELTKNSSASESVLSSQKAKKVTDLRKSLFRRSQRVKEKTFNVPFEQTIAASDSNGTSNEISLNASEEKKSKVERKTILFQKKSKDEEDDIFNVSCDETNSFTNASKNDSLRKVAIFGKRKKKRVEDTFDVPCEESQVEKDPDESIASTSGKVSFNENPSGLSPVNVSDIQNQSLQKSVQVSPVSNNSSIRATSQRSSALSHTQNSSFSYSDKSRMSQNATVIDKTEKSMRTISVVLNQSSFNDSTDDQPAEMPSPIPVESPPRFVSSKGKSAAPSNNIEKAIDWEAKFQQIVERAKRGEPIGKKKAQPLPAEKKKIVPSNKNPKKSPRPKLKKPAPYATKRLYKYLIDRLEPKFGIDATIKAEELVVDICETVKIATRRKTYQKKLINDLKVDMAKLGIIETTWDFYNFIRDFLPESFRNKSIPKIQPFTCQIWPPEDVANPFDKIL